jgi:hypothetical protein
MLTVFSSGALKLETLLVQKQLRFGSSGLRANAGVAAADATPSDTSAAKVRQMMGFVMA